MTAALSMEGGAMRGMFTCGVIDVFMENGITFDAAAGISAGAVFGCNYKSRQIGRPIRYNKRFSRDRRYCSVWSLLRTGDLYGADFCYRELPDELDVFDRKAFRENPMAFYVGATDVLTGKIVYHLCRDGETEDLLWMRASASMPVVSRPVTIGNAAYLDGGISDPVPLFYLQSLGFDRHVAILTQPRGYRKTESRATGLVCDLLRGYPAIEEDLRKRHTLYNAQMERIEEGSISLPRTVAYYKKERDGVQAVRNLEGVLCAIVCTENQTDIHYAEAARQFILDAYSYNKQLTDIRKRHEAEERVKDQLADIRKQDEAEERTKEQSADICKLDKPEGEIEEQVKGQEKMHSYQGFTPADHLIPAVTVCVYYGREPWNAPVRLVDLMDFSGFTKREARLWRKCIQDYRIMVLDIRRMPDEQIEGMSSDLKLLFGMLKNSEDKETLQGYIHQHEQEMDVMKEDLAEAFAVLSGTAGLRKYLKKNQGSVEGGTTIRMCKAIDDMMKDSKQEGRLEGEAKGRLEGEAKGRIEGRIEGEATGRYRMLVELIRDNLISLSEAAKRLNMTEEALAKQMET